jgi:putative protease
MGVVRDYHSEQEEAVVEVRNKFFQNDIVEFFGPETTSFSQEINYIKNEAGEEVETAPHPKELITVPAKKKVAVGDLVRRKKEEVK